MMATSYGTEIRPLFSAMDIACMAPHGVLLDDYAYMSDPAGDVIYADFANARGILDRVSGKVLPRMPKGAPPWPDVQVEMFRTWVSEGCPP
jgi:hypothetical protein